MNERAPQYEKALEKARIYARRTLAEKFGYEPDHDTVEQVARRVVRAVPPYGKNSSKCDRRK